MLDLNEMHTLFTGYFKGKVTVSHWFATLLHSSTVAALTNVETTFAELAKISLTKLVTAHTTSDIPERREFRKIPLQENAVQFIETALKTMASLKPHGDIVEALTLLKNNNFKTIAFSNSSKDLINQQITNAGLIPHFDQIISVEEAKSFKPHPKVYHYAAEILGEPIGNLTLVAAHDWDTHGAMKAGMMAAYLKRTQLPYNPLFEQPSITADTMTDIARQLIARTS